VALAIWLWLLAEPRAISSGDVSKTRMDDEPSLRWLVGSDVSTAVVESLYAKCGEAIRLFTERRIKAVRHMMAFVRQAALAQSPQGCSRAHDVAP
jgi:hypothetical protein